LVWLKFFFCEEFVYLFILRTVLVLRSVTLLIKFRLLKKNCLSTTSILLDLSSWTLSSFNFYTCFSIKYILPNQIFLKHKSLLVFDMIYLWHTSTITTKKFVFLPTIIKSKGFSPRLAILDILIKCDNDLKYSYCLSILSILPIVLPYEHNLSTPTQTLDTI
jgi:hypothetical protein